MSDLVVCTLHHTAPLCLLLCQAKEEGSLWKAGAMQGQSQTKGSATTAASHAAEGDGGFGSDTEMEDAETEFEGPDPLLDPSQSQAAAFAGEATHWHAFSRSLHAPGLTELHRCLSGGHHSRGVGALETLISTSHVATHIV